MCKALFEKMTPEMRVDWKEMEHHSRYKADAMLFQEQQKSYGLWSVIQGTVRVSMSSSDGRRFNVRLADEGDILGLINALHDTPFDTTAETLTDCTLAFVSQADLRRFMTKYPLMYPLVVEEVSRYLSAAHHSLRTVAMPFRVEEKIVRFLLERNEIPVGDKARVNLNMTHTEVGYFLGTTRENVTRIMSQLRKKKLIEFSGPRRLPIINIPSIHKLETHVGLDS